MARQNGVNRALGRRADRWEPPDQPLPNLRGSPVWPRLLDLQDQLLHLKRELVGLPIGPATSVGKGFQPTFPVPIDNLMSRDPGYPKLPTQGGDLLAVQEPGHEPELLVHLVTTIGKA